jgi:hypothetical protein
MIKSDLFTRGYTYEYFLSLDNNMEKGSRQLLICVGWLVYHIKLMEKCIEQCLKSNSILDHDDTSSLYQVYKKRISQSIHSYIYNRQKKLKVSNIHHKKKIL